jgi:pyruvate/2-oxoglutarate dehydrogenase complex dihydrolipoamide acyltransferase (E2) component
MGRFKASMSATAAAMVLTAGVAMAQGIVPDRSTIVTISAPVSVPGVVLPAGEYLFRLADSNANRNIVQIFNKERSKIFATLLAIPAERNEPSGDAVITFRESPANQAPALRYWYFAGEKTGQEFAYPKSQAIEIARASHESVMAMDSSSGDMDTMKSAELHRIDANSPEVMAESPAAQNSTAAPAQSAETTAPAATTPAAPAAPVEAQSPTPAPTEPQATTPAPTQAAAEKPAAEPRAETPAPTEPQATGTSGRTMNQAPAATAGRSASAPAAPARELPKTAGELPLVTVLGFLALGAAIGVRALRRSMVV